MTKIVVLSAPIIIGEGAFIATGITIEEAKRLARFAENFSAHQTVKLLDLEPQTERKNCKDYDIAIVIAPIIAPIIALSPAKS